MTATRADRAGWSEMREEASDLWWLFLITGIIWLWASIVVLRFNNRSITAVGVGARGPRRGVRARRAVGLHPTGGRLLGARLGARLRAGHQGHGRHRRSSRDQAHERSLVARPRYPHPASRAGRLGVA